MSPELRPIVELRFGDSWMANVRYLLALANQAGESHADLRCVRDVIDIVVGGDNLTADLGADGIFLVLADLLAGLDDLLSGRRSKVIVDFKEAPWELALARRGGHIALSLYSVLPGEDVAVHDRVAPLRHVVQAVVSAADSVARQLDDIQPGLSTHELLRVPQRVRAHARGEHTDAQAVTGGQVAEPTGMHIVDAGRLRVALDLNHPGLFTYDGDEFDLHSLLCGGAVSWLSVQPVTIGDRYPVRTVRGLVADLRDVLEALGGRKPRPVRRLRSAVLTDVEREGTRMVALVPGGVFMRAGPAAPPDGAVLVAPEDLFDAVTAAVVGVTQALVAVNPQLGRNERLMSMGRDSAGLIAWFQELAVGNVRGPSNVAGVGARCTELGAQQPDLSQAPAAYALTELRRMRLRLRWSHTGPLRVADVRRGDGCVYVPRAGGLVSYALEDGSERWAQGAASSGEAPDLWFLRDRAVQADSEGVRVFDDGGGRWSADAQVSGTVQGLATFDAGEGGELVVARAGGVEGFCLASGAQRWSIPVRHGRAQGFGAAGLHAVVGSERGFVYGVDVGRREVAWRTHVGVSRAVPFLSPRRALLVASSQPPELLCVDAATGDVQWATPLPSTPAFVRHSCDLVLVGTGASVLGVDASDGRVCWRRDEVTESLVVLPVGGDGIHRCVTQHESGLACFDAKTGVSLWREDCPVQVMTSAGPDVVATASPDGVVLFRAEDGSVLHELDGLPPSPSFLDVGSDLTFLVGEVDDESGEARLSCFELAYFLALVR